MTLETANSTSIITIHSVDQLDEYFAKVREAARKAHQWIAQQTDDPIAFLRSVKFEKRGYHPINGHRLNLIEQVNQTWTYTVALKATRILFDRHPQAKGFTLAPGATASQELDIMSIAKGVVGAETFAATTPDSNRKMMRDMEKFLKKEHAFEYRYIFFASPTHPHTESQPKYEKNTQGFMSGR